VDGKLEVTYETTASLARALRDAVPVPKYELHCHPFVKFALKIEASQAAFNPVAATPVEVLTGMPVFEHPDWKFGKYEVRLMHHADIGFSVVLHGTIGPEDDGEEEDPG
jgi:hypothetical protein